MYTAQITRTRPTCIIFLVDQSRSMIEAFAGDTNVRKSDFVAETVNHTLHDLVIRCTKTEEVRDYYHVAIIGYGGRDVRPAFAGALQGRTLVPVSQVAEYPARIETRYKKIADPQGNQFERVVRFPSWIEPIGEGGTPMCAAFSEARRLLSDWIANHPDSFPPVVLHLTDGESSDGNPVSRGREIMDLQTSDGNVLLFNCHISARPTPRVEYPFDADNLPDDFARALFEISSVLPQSFRNAAIQLGVKADEGSRGFVFNANPSSVIQFYEIGTSLTSMTPHAWMDKGLFKDEGEESKDE